jgi:hypothetical protein
LCGWKRRSFFLFSSFSSLFLLSFFRAKASLYYLFLLALSHSVSRASGDAFGPRTPVILQLLELPGAMKTLEGVEMELRDCAFPILKDIIMTDKPEVAFAGVDYALLVGMEQTLFWGFSFGFICARELSLSVSILILLFLVFVLDLDLI